MSDVGTDRTDARLSRIEGTVDQMDKRLGRAVTQLDELSGRIDGLNGRIDETNQQMDDRFTALQTDMRRWLYLLLFAISVVFTVITAVIQLVLA